MYLASFSAFDETLLLLCLAIRQRQMSAIRLEWIETTAVVIGILVLGYLLFRVIQTRHATVASQQWDGPGKVLLFPCRMSHVRMSPQKHSFSYSYLTVGVPVSFEGNTGGMVSIGSTNAGKKGNPTISASGAWFTIDAEDYLERGRSELGLRGKLDAYLRSQGVDPATYPHAYLVTAPRFLGCCFNPVSFWYLYGPEQRLTAMVLEVNNTFDERRMYFLTADGGGDDDKNERQEADSPPPSRTLGGSSSQQRRRHIFKQTWPKDFHVSPFNPREGTYTLSATDPLRYQPCSTSRGPAVAITITLYPPTHGGGHHGCHPPTSNNNTTTATPTSNTTPNTTTPNPSTNKPLPLPLPLLTTSLQSLTPLDPLTTTPHQNLLFLLRWAWLPLLTYPRILLQASLFFFQRRLRVWTRPEPLPGTICRRAREEEMGLEGVVGGYIGWVVSGSGSKVGAEKGRERVVLRYVPAGVEGGVDVAVRCRGAKVGERREREGWERKKKQKQQEEEREEQGAGRLSRTVERAGKDGVHVDEGKGEDQELEFRVLTPAFYSRLVSYDGRHGHESLLRELDGGTIWVSRPDLLRKLVQGKQKRRRAREDHGLGSGAAPAAAGWFERACFWLIRRLRRARPSWESSDASGYSRTLAGQPSALDAYVMTHEPAEARRTYANCVLKLLLADRIAFGLLPLLEMQLLLLRGCIVWCLSSAVEIMRKGWAVRGRDIPLPTTWKDEQGSGLKIANSSME